MASEPPRSAHLCEVRPNIRKRERRVKRRNKGKEDLESDVRSTITSMVSVRGFRNWANQNDGRRNRKKKRNDITIILHLQRLRRIFIVNSGPIIQKPKIFVYKAKVSWPPINRHSNAGREKNRKTTNKFVELRRHRAPDAINILSNLVRIRTLELGQLRCAFDLEEYLVSRGRDDLSSWHPQSA